MIKVHKGKVVERLLRSARLGDAFHVVAKPIAVALKLDCIDPDTKQLRPESKCAKRRARWNGTT